MKVLYTIVAVLGFAFFVWLLVNMASGADGATGLLNALAISFLLVLVAIGAAGFLSRRDDPDLHR
jgi:hypothetical protein